MAVGRKRQRMIKVLQIAYLFAYLSNSSLFYLLGDTRMQPHKTRKTLNLVTKSTSIFDDRYVAFSTKLRLKWSRCQNFDFVSAMSPCYGIVIFLRWIFFYFAWNLGLKRKKKNVEYNRIHPGEHKIYEFAKKIFWPKLY